MVAAKTTDDLITAVNARCALPSADDRLSTAEKLDLASQRLTSTIAELLVSSRSQRWVQSGSDVAISSGTYLYDVPERALASGVADIKITDGSVEWDPPEILFRDAHLYRSVRGNWAAPYAYTWLDDKIELLPHPTTGGAAYYLRIYYPRAAPKLVPTTSCAPVTASTSTTITATSAQTILGASATIDVVKGTPNGAPRGMDLSASIATNTVTVSATPTGTASGDYVCLAGQTCVLPMPQSLWQVIVLATSADVLDALGDSERLAAVQIELGAAMREARGVLEPRSRGATHKVINRNGPLRQLRGWR